MSVPAAKVESEPLVSARVKVRPEGAADAARGDQARAAHQ